MLNLLTVARRAATLGFLLLFPGFLLYHYAIANGWIPAFLGGLFGAVSLVVALIAVALFPFTAHRQLGAARLPGAFIALVIGYFAAWAVVNYLFIAEPYAAPALRETAAAIGTWIATMFVGLYFTFDSRRTRRTVVVFALLIVLALLHAMIRFKSPLGPYLTFSGADPDSTVSTYQAVGRSIVVTAIFLAAVVGHTRYRIVVLAIAAFFLVLLGSRTDAFTLLALMTVVVLGTVMRVSRPASSLSALLAGALFVHLTMPLFLQTRNAEILDLSSSSSWQARQELQTAAVRVIRDNPVLGTFGYHFRDGGAGYYAHNVLSAWTNFGFLGFVLYLSLLVYFVSVSLWNLLKADRADALWFAAFHLNLAALVQALFAQPVFALLPALGWGVALNAMRSHPSALPAFHGSTQLARAAR
jgi:hypothetical protein